MCDDCPATHLKEHLLVGDDAILFQQCAGICDPVALNHLLARGLVLGFERFRRRREAAPVLFMRLERAEVRGVKPERVSVVGLP